ncbi:MAG TPA: cytidine deaminase [Solirubrobacteraceae bacterium]|nr:cytidine deaminase [Solirubrobacteraceae bacterium]
MAAPRRNLELKARDPDPEATLAALLAAGASDEGLLRQRDTYFAAAAGRLKLREERPGGAHLVAYERADEARERESRYHLAAVADPSATRTALAAALGITVVVEKERRLLLAGNVRVHLDAVAGLGTFVELEAVVPPAAPTAGEARRVTALRAALGITDDRLVEHGYAALLLDAGGAREALVDAARRAMRHAYVPYSRFAVGAALRDEAGRIHSGANVENAAYPQGQCAEASAVGALASAGGRRIAEVAVMADTDLVTPCGGCRQRLSELAAPQTPVHLCGPEGVRRTLTLGELLPLGFGPGDLPA